MKKIVEKYLIIAYPRGKSPLKKKLIPREKFRQNTVSGKPRLPENSLQGIKLPFRKFRLYFRLYLATRKIAYCWMLLVQVSKGISEPGQAYRMKILAKIVNGLKFILRLI